MQGCLVLGATFVVCTLQQTHLFPGHCQDEASTRLYNVDTGVLESKLHVCREMHIYMGRHRQYIVYSLKLEVTVGVSTHYTFS